MDSWISALKKALKFYAQVAGEEALKNAEKADQFGWNHDPHQQFSAEGGGGGGAPPAGFGIGVGKKYSA